MAAFIPFFTFSLRKDFSVSFLVTHSAAPLFFDALPALKVRHYTKEGSAANIYSYARFYLLNGQLALNLYAFEKEPPATSCIGFAIHGETSLLIEARPQECFFYTLDGTAKTSIATEAQPSFFAGQDEQGWYWGVSLVLPSSLLSLCGGSFLPGNSFPVAVLKYASQGNDFGCSAPIKNPSFMLDFNNFSLCDIVSY